MKTALSFQQAVNSLRDFLAEQRKPATVCWVFRDDVFQYKRQVFVKWPLPEDNEAKAERLYEMGRERELGLAIEVFCFDKRQAYCYVFIPEDAYESEALMLTELKLSYSESDRSVIRVRTKWLWRAVKTVFPRSSSFTWADFIPLRNAVWR
jgi:hypothetical protein